MTRVDFTVLGTPAPQGSKVRTQWGMREDNPKTRPWRQEVAAVALERMQGLRPLTGPLYARLTFTMPRPKGHYRTGKFAGELKAGAPLFCPKKPDVDKLQRAIFDSCSTAGVWLDDSQVAIVDARKVYEQRDARPGVHVVVEMLDALYEARAT